MLESERGLGLGIAQIELTAAVAVVWGRFGYDAAMAHVHEGTFAKAFARAGRNESPCGWLCVDGQLFAVLCDEPVFRYVCQLTPPL